jgi:hypothetical protein
MYSTVAILPRVVISNVPLEVNVWILKFPEVAIEPPVATIPTTRSV